MVKIISRLGSPRSQPAWPSPTYSAASVSIRLERSSSTERGFDRPSEVAPLRLNKKMDKIKKNWKIEAPENPNIRAMLSLPPAYYQSRLRKIEFVGEKTKLLDAGCGSGIWSIAASYLNSEVHGIDSTKDYLKVAQEIQKKFKIKNLKLKIGKMESLPYPDSFFDYVISYCAWMYTDRPQSLAEMVRVLKPGGKIYLGAVAGLGWYLKLIIEAIKTGNRDLLATSLRAIGAKIQTPEKETRRLFAQNNLHIVALGPDASLGQNSNLKPIYKPKILGFWNVYEVTAKKGVS